MKRGRKRKYCKECHCDISSTIGGHFDSNGLCNSCEQKSIRKYIDAGKKYKKTHSGTESEEGRLWKFNYEKGAYTRPKALNMKALNISKSMKGVEPKRYNWKKMHCATKELNVYERLEIIEKQCKCIQKLRKEVADLRKQVYG